MIDTSLINKNTIIMGNVHHWDYPDLVDAYIEDAWWLFGRRLSDEELDELNMNTQFVHECAIDDLINR